MKDVLVWAAPVNRLRKSFSRQYGPVGLPSLKRYGEKALIRSKASALRTRDKMTYVVSISVSPGSAVISPQSANAAFKVSPCVMKPSMKLEEAESLINNYASGSLEHVIKNTVDGSILRGG